MLAAVAAEALHAPSCYIYEFDAAGDAILWRSEFHSHPEHRDPDPPGTRYPLDDYPWDRDVLASGRMRLFTIDDPTLPPAQLASMREWDELSMLTVPLRFGDETVGMMEIAESRPGTLIRHRRDRARASARRAGGGGHPKRASCTAGRPGATSVSSRCWTSAAS